MAQLNCYACGNHNFSNCRHKNYKCKICNKLGHIAKACKKAQASTNYLKDDLQNSDTSDEEVTEMFNLRGNHSIVEPLKVSIKINNKHIVMEIDSGYVSIAIQVISRSI